MLVLALVISILTFQSSIKRWKYFYRYGISPTALYSGMWGFTYLIHIINPFDYRQISSSAIFLSMVPMIAIYLGERTAYPKKRALIEFSYLVPNENLKRMILFLSIIVLIAALLLFLAAYAIYGEFWMSGSGASLKQDRTALGSAAFSGAKYGFIAKYFAILQGLAQLSLIMGLFYNYFQKKTIRTAVLFPLVAIAMMSVSFGSRAQIGGAFWIYILFYIIHYKGKIFNILKVKSLIYGILVIMLITQITLSTRIINAIEIKGNTYPRIMVQMFDYSVGPLIAFDNELKNAESSFGRISFYGIESFLSMAKLVSVPPPEQFLRLERATTHVQNNYTYLRTLNTYSWLLYLYYDFNLFGLLIIPFCISFIITRQSTKYYYYTNGKLLRGSFLILMSMLLLATTGTFLFRNLDFVFSLFVLLLFSIQGSFFKFYKNSMKFKK